MLNFHGNALADSAEVYALAGRADEAREQLEQALALYQQKGNLVAASGGTAQRSSVLQRAHRCNEPQGGRC